MSDEKVESNGKLEEKKNKGPKKHSVVLVFDSKYKINEIFRLLKKNWEL